MRWKKKEKKNSIRILGACGDDNTQADRGSESVCDRGLNSLQSSATGVSQAAEECRNSSNIDVGLNGRR